jgi:hypothetical protein
MRWLALALVLAIASCERSCDGPRIAAAAPFMTTPPAACMEPMQEERCYPDTATQ